MEILNTIGERVAFIGLFALIINCVVEIPFLDIIYKFSGLLSCAILFLNSIVEDNPDGWIARSLENFFCSDNDNYTPVQKNNNTRALLLACCMGDLYTIKILVDHGYDINIKNEFSCLHVACFKNHADVVEYLLFCGADVSIKDWQGSTALNIACRKRGRDKALNKEEYDKKSLRIVNLLLECGADPKIKNNRNETALYYSIRDKNIKITELLLKYSHGPDRLKNIIISKFTINKLNVMNNNLKNPINKNVLNDLTKFSPKHNYDY